MLRKLLMTTVAASTMIGSAYAADLPSRQPAPAYVPPAPVFTWTGFYIGVNAGGAFRVRNDFDNNVFFASRRCSSPTTTEILPASSAAARPA
jgi:outer membrane immunogenic protein